MGKFNFINTPIEGLYVIEPKVFEDDRGYFMETYNYEEFRQAGLDMMFVQDNQSKSKRGVLRGLHFQKKHPQGKLVRVVSGEIFDVAVDIRKSSSTYGKWFGINLSSDNKKQMYIPVGFAHGFLVVSDEAEIVYKCNEIYHPEDEGGIIWNDSNVAVNWPIDSHWNILLSEKDKKLERLK